VLWSGPDLARDRRFADSPLEGAGFEPSVPPGRLWRHIGSSRAGMVQKPRGFAESRSDHYQFRRPVVSVSCSIAPRWRRRSTRWLPPSVFCVYLGPRVRISLPPAASPNSRSQRDQRYLDEPDFRGSLPYRPSLRPAPG
jgi:hypothetical protein